MHCSLITHPRHFPWAFPDNLHLSSLWSLLVLIFLLLHIFVGRSCWYIFRRFRPLYALALFSTPIYENHSPSNSQLLVYPAISHFRSPFTDALRFFFDSISNLRCLCPLDHLPQCDLIVMAKFYMYADDTTIYVAASSPGTVVVLNVILQKLYDWCCLNRLILPHSGKTN